MNTVMFFLLTICVASVFADVYMHSPRGSNDRNCERNDNRNNGNRLFDSNNNDAGGYACPRPVSGTALLPSEVMYYYENSLLQIEWTQQHGCGAGQDQTYCQIILQYMCEEQNPGLRDGTPTSAQDAATDTMNDQTDVTNLNYGYHETYPYYQACATRYRNNGLYTADQKLGGSTAIFTRQNPNGNRHGWECSEELDYYPYWHPAPWKDIAIITADFGKNGFPSCSSYQSMSQNNKGYGSCWATNPVNNAGMEKATPLKFNTPETCKGGNGVWYVATPNGGGDPACVSPPSTRPNVLGNDMNGEIPSYTWKIPSFGHGNAQNPDAGSLCVLRLRYNISSNDVPWNLDMKDNFNHDSNKLTGPNTSPMIQPFAPFASNNIDGSDILGAYNLSLRVNTNQYGRTFQDRSYTFYIRSRKSSMPQPGVSANTDAIIHNVGVRGKRGNIVQTFPSVEYDFVPRVLNIGQWEIAHFQWTGSDYNPNRQPNNAEGGPQDLANPGNYRADRSNLVQQKGNDPANNIPQATYGHSGDGFFSVSEASRMAFLNQEVSNPNICYTWTELLNDNNNNQAQANLDDHNCYKLNGAPSPYFDGGLVVAHAPIGTYHMYSTRNNNFSNRSQKMIINVHHVGLTAGQIAGIAIGSVTMLGIGSAIGGYQYAKRHPNSAIAGHYSNFFAHPFVQKITSHPILAKIFH